MHQPQDTEHDGGEVTYRTSPFAYALRLVGLTVTAGVIVGAGVAMLTTAMDNSRRQTLREPTVPEPAVATVDQAPPDETPTEFAQPLLDAQAEVVALEAQLAEKELALEAVAAAAGLDPAEVDDQGLVNEVATLRANLVAARQVRDRLKSQLREALAAVELQSDETVRARAHAAAWQSTSLRTRWAALTATAQAQVCDHGTRKSVDKCQDGVASYFTDARFERFAECANSAGATPSLLAVPRGQEVPSTAEAIGQRPLFARQDWYVLYCDPRLPERPDDAEVAEAVGTPDRLASLE